MVVTETWNKNADNFKIDDYDSTYYLVATQGTD